MPAFSEAGSIISIRDTVKTHKQLNPNIPSAHALTGCDTVPMMYGIGKKKAISVAKKSFSVLPGTKGCNRRDNLLLNVMVPNTKVPQLNR